MSKSKQYISLKTPYGIKQVFSIDFYSDGGFFIQDLIRLGQNNRQCYIAKTYIDNSNNGVRNVTPHYKGFTSGDVKVSHHKDGRFQISGKGVLSGFENDGAPKGAAVNSFPLHHSNDGGPFYIINCWGFESFRDGSIEDIILEPSFTNLHPYDEEKVYGAIFIKAFYILKKDICEIRSIIKHFSNIEGWLTLTLVSTPLNTPGVIGLYASLCSSALEERVGFTISAAPGKKINGRFSEALNIIYPYGKANGTNLNHTS